MKDAPAVEPLVVVAKALAGYLSEVQRDWTLCVGNEKKTAIHEKGKSLQVYRMYKAKAEIMDQVRFAAQSLRSWEKLPCWKHCGGRWDKLAAEVAERVESHGKQHALLTRKIIWEQRPMLIHAYKFEPDTHMKIELIPLKCIAHQIDNPLKEVACVLRCHDHLVPPFIAEPRPPYEKHETDFATISEYLSATMPSGLYASTCVRRAPHLS